MLKIKRISPENYTAEDTVTGACFDIDKQNGTWRWAWAGDYANDEQPTKADCILALKDFIVTLNPHDHHIANSIIVHLKAQIYLGKASLSRTQVAHLVEHADYLGGDLVAHQDGTWTVKRTIIKMDDHDFIDTTAMNKSLEAMGFFITDINEGEYKRGGFAWYYANVTFKVDTKITNKPSYSTAGDF